MYFIFSIFVIKGVIYIGLWLWCFCMFCYYYAKKREAYEFINSLMDEIVKDCNMARELQKQMKELMKSVNRKEALIEKIRKYYEWSRRLLVLCLSSVFVLCVYIINDMINLEKSLLVVMIISRITPYLHKLCKKYIAIITMWQS